MPTDTKAPPSTAPIQSTEPIPEDLIWQQRIHFQDESGERLFSLTNFAGRVYPSPHDGLMTYLLQIQPKERVVDIGGGDAFFTRANVVTDAFPEDNAHRSGRKIATDYGERKFVTCYAESLPFADGEFDFAYCRAVLEHVVDPAAACRELQRVAKRGFIETPSPLAEYLGGHPTHRWLVWIEQLPGQEPTLVFRRKPFRRAPFGYVLRGMLFTDPDFCFRWEFEYRNLICTQLAWSGSFRFRVEPDPDGFDYDDPEQAAEAHLDAAINSLRYGGVPNDIILPDAEEAVRLRPEWALAHNTRGCVLWLQGCYEQARAAFEQAHRLESNRPEYRRNAQLRSGHGLSPTLNLLPPPPDEMEDIETNFAGKVYYAFLNYDDRLARDLNIRPGERVLDVGGGQRPLARADVSVDFDILEGVHRQGHTIKRDRPLVCGDAQRLPFRDKAFDVACCRMVLEHVVDPAAACRELQRVAKRGFIETPNLLWESFYGHPTHRWIVSWEEPARTLVFRRRPFAFTPFRSAMVYHLYRSKNVMRAFEVTFRNLTTTQITWDEAHPFDVRVEDDPNCPYDYLARPEDASAGSLAYAEDMLRFGLPEIATAEADAALRCASTPQQHEAALNLRARIREVMRAAGIEGAEGEKGRRGEGEQSQIDNRQSTIENPLHPVFWNAPLRDPSGYAEEARNFLFALDAAGVEVAARAIKWSDRVAHLPAARERRLQRMLTSHIPENCVHVLHILAPYFQRYPQARARVGRTMFETDRLPEGWAEKCNQMDAIWVPSAFNVETFTRAGVQPQKLRIVPGAIDLAPYDPGCVPLQIQGARGFNFLSVFDWTLRKGWDVLVRAFVEEFQPEEDVALIIKAHSSLGYTGEQLLGVVADYIARVLGRDPNRIPDIILQDTNVPDERMPNLYRAADCYVMPTRGEGWGRPFMEAMAIGLPVIATGWSGQTAFMNSANSLVLDYELVDVPAAAWQETPTFRGHRWAEPSLPHLRQLMRYAFEDRSAGRELGCRARAHLEANFTYGPVAQILKQEIARFA